MDLSVLTPSADTVAAIFGSPDPSMLVLRDAETGVAVHAGSLIPGAKYTANLLPGCQEPQSWVPIKQIAAYLDETRVRKLSTAFYTRVWADDEHTAFRSVFIGHAESVEAAADAQWRWLIEMWGGAKRYSDRFGQGTLLTRMLSKHKAARMQYRFCHRWLEHMLAAMEEVGLRRASEAALAESICRYWLHFFGFFEMTVDQRRELRALAFAV
eukprot:CAMPEP_0115862460 /NCGR_PEP_ID=MMETSP0287-20121206/18185_1 /TAXON_ID=412157 /ORGANISM="Chrysochromulina rotalis, Strain UIO044" /LENGTH=211 /DNA_ID=CAMNT_0003316877 /DNA_START=198 /DNA_END=833 /DNA_ORIENTATION=+